MKKASNLKLSLRKLFIAMLATGPITILPSPLLAVVPNVMSTDTSFNVNNAGTRTIVLTAGVGNLTSPDGFASTANINVSDKSVLVWSRGVFNIDAGQAYNFNVSNNGSVLNRVGYQVNGATMGADSVNIAGNLSSTGRVIVLVNGAITVDGSARIDTARGLVLSTIQDSSDFNFTTQGVVASTGTSLGTITIGNTTASPNVVNGGLEAYAGTINLERVNFSTSATGDLVLRTITPNSALNLGANGAVAVTNGNISISTNNGAVTDGSAISTNTISVTTGGTAGITLDNPANAFTNISLSTNGGSATIADVGGVTINASNLTTAGNLTITSTGQIATAGAVTANVVALNGGGEISFGNSSTVSGFNATTTSGNVTFSGGTSAVTFGPISVTGGGFISLTTSSAATLNGNVTTTGNITVTGSSVAQTATGNIPATAGVVTLNATNGSITVGNIAATRIDAIATGSISQLGGTVLTTAASSSNFTAGTGGSILLTGNNVMDNATVTFVGGTASISNSQPIVIANANLTGGLTINTTNATVGDGGVTLGSGSGTASANIQVGGGLTIATNASQITDDDDLTIRVFGPLTLSTATATTPNPTLQTGNITLDSTTGASGRGSASFGQISANVGNLGNVTIVENQTINFGTIIANVLTGNSVSGSILFSGQATANAISANANAGGISQTASLNITSGQASSFRSSNTSATILDNPSNIFSTGNINIVNGGNNILVANSQLALGNATATNNLTVTQTAAGAGNVVRLVQNNGTAGITGNNIIINAAGPISVESTSAIRALTLNTTDTTAITSNTTGAISSATNGNLQVNGTLTLITQGGVNLRGNTTISPTTGLTTASTGNGTNITGTVVLSNVTSNVVLVNQRNLTLTGTGGNVSATTGFGPFAGTWNLNLGNLNVGNLTANVVVSEPGTVNSTLLGASGNITQVAGSSVHVENMVQFISFNGGNIVVGNNGNSFGRVEAYTGGSANLLPLASPGLDNTRFNAGSVTIVEDSTLKVGNVVTAANATLTSRFGSVIEDTVASLTATNLTVGGVASLLAPNGSILLGGTTNGGNTTGAVSTFNVTAPSGAVAVQSSGNITLGSTAANSLFVRSGNHITQNGPLSIFGLSTFNATNSITLNDAANNFGPLVLISGTANQNISVTEAGTLNLRTVTMPGALANGTFTANSVNGDIIDTGLGNVRPGGLVGSLGVGVVSLFAANGNIVIDDPTTDFPTQSGVAFNAKNVTLSVLGSGTSPTSLNLGAASTTSVATGNLIASSALGNITNTGSLTVGGSAFFQTGAGNIAINQSANRFGSVRFVGNQVTIIEVDDTAIMTGSSAIGQASIQSGGNITITNAGGGSVTFGNVVSLAASGSITLPKLIQAVGTLAVNAVGTKDLSALSISGDLSGKPPSNSGPGAYLPPQP